MDEKQSKPLSELDVMKRCERAISKLPPLAQKRVINWIFDRFEGEGYLMASSAERVSRQLGGAFSDVGDFEGEK